MTTDPTTAATPTPSRAVAAPVTLIFIFLNVAVYLLQVVQGVNWLEPSNQDLVHWGANVSPLTLYGDNWRLVSSMFVHVGVVHLLMNMYMLLMMGSLLEQRFGSLVLVAVYMATGIAGALASAWWNAVHTVQVPTLLGWQVGGEFLRVVVCVGASGAVMGLAAALLVASLRPQDEEPEPGKMTKALLQVVGFNIVLGFALTGVDQAAHLGGAFAGAVCGGLLLAGQGLRGIRGRLGVAVVIAVAGGALYVGASHIHHSEQLDELHQEVLQEWSIAVSASGESAGRHCAAVANPLKMTAMAQHYRVAIPL